MKPNRRASFRRIPNQTKQVTIVTAQPPGDLVNEECLLCLESIRSQTSDSSPSWDFVWTENCAESLCKMLDLSVDMFKVFFIGSYCPTCKQMIRDVDYLIRTVDTLEKQLSSYRVQVSTLLHENFETWINRRNIPTVSAYPHLPSGEASNPNSCQQDPVVATPAPSSVGSDFQPTEIKQNDEEDDDPHPSPMNSPNETCRILVTNFDLPHLHGGLKEDQEVTWMQRVDQNSLLNAHPLPGIRLGRVTRASNRLDKGITYREETDLEDSQSTNNACPDMNVESCEDEPQTKKTGQLNSRRRRVYPRAATTSRADLSFPSAGNVSTSSEEVTSLSKKRRLDSGNVQNSPTRPKRMRSCGPRRVRSARREHESIEATMRFLSALKREDAQKNYPYICTSTKCGLRFRDYARLQRHKLHEHSEALSRCSFQCPFCPSLWCLHDYQLDAHIIGFHQGEKMSFVCPVMDCPAKYAKNASLVIHLLREHPYYPIEELRSSKFSLGVEYRDKMVPGVAGKNNKTTLRMLKCPVPGCPTRWASQLTLDMHQIKAHDKDPLPFKCREEGCSKAFTNYESGYKRHMKLVHGAVGQKSNVVTCLLCSFRCVGGPFQLNLHMRRRHAKEDVPKFNCKICGYLYFVSGECEEHEKLHTELTGFDCVIRHCQAKGFVSQEALRAHTLQTHIQRQGKVCDICGSVYVSNTVLAGHKRTHLPHGEEPFKCRYCDRRFKNKANRTSHEQIMHGDKMEKKTYKCKQCDETFTAQQYLYKHNAWHKHGANANLPVAKKKLIQDFS